MIRLQGVPGTMLMATLVSLAFLGCAKQQDDAKRFGQTAKVAGKVNYAGNPVKNARIQFSSKETAAAIIAEVIGGEFAMDDPVPLGTYKVAVIPPEERAPEAGVTYVAPKYDDIPLKYRDEFNTDLSAEVKEGENEFTFDMKP